MNLKCNPHSSGGNIAELKSRKPFQCINLCETISVDCWCGDPSLVRSGVSGAGVSGRVRCVGGGEGGGRHKLRCQYQQNFQP